MNLHKSDNAKFFFIAVVCLAKYSFAQSNDIGWETADKIKSQTFVSAKIDHQNSFKHVVFAGWKASAPDIPELGFLSDGNFVNVTKLGSTTDWLKNNVKKPESGQLFEWHRPIDNTTRRPLSELLTTMSTMDTANQFYVWTDNSGEGEFAGVIIGLKNGRGRIISMENGLTASINVEDNFPISEVEINKLKVLLDQNSVFLAVGKRCVSGTFSNNTIRIAFASKWERFLTLLDPTITEDVGSQKFAVYRGSSHSIPSVVRQTIFETGLPTNEELAISFASGLKSIRNDEAMRQDPLLRLLK